MFSLELDEKRVVGERGMINLRARRKGDISAATVVGIVLTVVGFLIVLVFFGILKNGTDISSQREICRLSVLTRATAPNELQGSVPLKCTTEKICISEGGKCSQFAGEPDVQTVKLSGTVDEKKKAIEKASADAMLDCWSMMGEGKLDLFGNFGKGFGLKPAEGTCVICSRIGIAEDVDKEGIANSVDLNSYLQENNVPGSSLSYMQTFLGDKSISAYPKVSDDFNEQLSDKGNAGAVAKGEKNRNEVAFVFMQIKALPLKDVLKNLVGAGFAVAGATFVTPGGSLARKAVFTPAGLVTVGAAVVGVVAYATYNTYEGRAAAAGYCGQFTTSDEKAKEGCSIVQAVPYNFNDINKLCASSIQGNP